MTVEDCFVEIGNPGLTLRVRHWPGPKRPFVLVHGLASNCHTWDLTAERLAAAGHRVIAVDQRGHGLSDKPDEGYDFATITTDLAHLLAALEVTQPIMLGQSWGGNVLLEFGARYPELARGLGFIDGGFIDLQARPEASWERVAQELKPPDLTGTPREQMKAYMRLSHPDWPEAGIEATLANFETLPDGTVRAWLTLSRHLLILRAMWEQQPQALYPHVTVPVLICVAEDRNNRAWSKTKAGQVAAAQSGLPQAEVHWFEDTDHDLHIQRPEALVALLLERVQRGFW